MTNPIEIVARGRRYLLLDASALLRIGTVAAHELLQSHGSTSEGFAALTPGTTVAPHDRDATIAALADAIGRGDLLLAELHPRPYHGLLPVGPGGAPSLDDDWDTFVPLSDLVDPAVEPPTWCELQIWLLDDGPLAGAELRVHTSDGAQHSIETDADGVARIEGIRFGSATQFALLRAPEWGERKLESPPGARRLAVSDDLRVACPATIRTTVVLTRELVFDFDDITFGNERAVFLPEPPVDHRTDTPMHAPRGLAALASVLAFARTHPEHALWIAGHSDALGTGASDVPLSASRADNVRLALLGDIDGWAAHTMTVWAVEDLQRALAWVARTLAWDCDPGPCDNEMGAKSHGALTRFREHAAALDGTPVVVDGDVVMDDWRSIARRFEHELAGMLPDDPAAIRGALRELEGSPTACAATRPRRPPPEGRAEGTARRVELVFVPQQPGVPTAAEPLAEVVYASTASRLRYIPRLGLDADLTWISLKVVHAGDGRALPGRRVRLRYAMGVEREHDTDEAGWVTFAELPPFGTADVVVLRGGASVDAVVAAAYDEVDDPSPAAQEPDREESAEGPVEELYEEAADLDDVPPPGEPEEPPTADDSTPSDDDEVDDDDVVDDDDDRGGR